jgi:hypothetical protein
MPCSFCNPPWQACGPRPGWYRRRLHLPPPIFTIFDQSGVNRRRQTCTLAPHLALAPDVWHPNQTARPPPERAAAGGPPPPGPPHAGATTLQCRGDAPLVTMLSATAVDTRHSMDKLGAHPRTGGCTQTLIGAPQARSTGPRAA